MNLLINEPPLQVLPSLAKKVGLNGAIFLQQLHYRLLISTNIRDGEKWVYQSYPEWRDKEFPFWSVDTVKRTITQLESDGYVIGTNAYNKMKMDKTKWYRIDYSKLGYYQSVQNAPIDRAKSIEGGGQSASCDEGKMHRAIPKDIKSIKNNNVELALDDTFAIIEYLNIKASKNFKSTTPATKKFINGRLAEGYTVEDFKRVIDVKVTQWLNNPDMNSYLRPSTLFSPTNFENYLNENTTPREQATPRSTPKPLELDFNQGEDV